MYQYLLFYNLPITPVLFKYQIKLRYLRCFGLLVDILHCQRYRDLIILTIVNRIYGFAPIFPDTCYHLTHYWPAAADIPVASDNPVHYADAIRYNARTPLQGSLLPLTRLV